MVRVSRSLLALTGALLASCSTASSPCEGQAELCGGACVDTRSDGANCGGCGQVCEQGRTCVSGACRPACPGTQLVCDESCVNPQTDPRYCGATTDCAGENVGVACAAGQACQDGRCGCPAAGQLACGGACVDPATSLQFCGASGDCAGSNAGAACLAGQTCTGGRCGCPSAGQLSCGGACVDPATNPQFCGATADCAGANVGVACADDESCQAGRCVSRCEPTELDLSTPFATTRPSFTLRPGQQQPTPLWASTTAPLPTNTFWQNLVMGSGGSRFVVLPYQLKAEPVWLDVATLQPTDGATRVDVPENRQLMLGALQFGAGTQHAVVGYDLLSVTLRYSMAGGTMTAPLVQGSPYVTVDYAGSLRPMMLPGNFTFTRVNGSTTPGRVMGTRFEVGLSDGTTWLVYASSPLAFNWTSSNLVAAGSFVGWLRVAHAPDPAGAAVLDAHANVIPRGGHPEVTTSCDDATLSLVFTATGAGSLLMMAMPHHRPRLTQNATTDLTHTTINGQLRGVLGSTWVMRLPLSQIGFQAPRPIAPARLDAVKAALAVDAAYVPERAVVDNDPYFGGKQVAKLARLALIAEEVGESATAATLRARLRPLVGAWLSGRNGNPLVYDTTWGGVVATSALADPGAAFGSGHYNDHHFHFGYFVYAAAVLARSDPSFVPEFRDGLLALVRDIANPSATDPYFPRFRHLDFFRGHSWAAGLSEFGDGQNQESTSEAVNAWHALNLLGQALGDRRLRNLGRVMQALEVDAARTYWQVPAASSIYGPVFRENRCVGILFQTSAQFTTFFGAEAEFVYGIQLLPFTPASEELISRTWISDAWPRMQSAAAGASQGWKGLLYMAHATAASEAAWGEVNGLTAWDDGNSKTNTLWWVATRP